MKAKSDMKEVLVPVSPGELLDKITILRIKVARIMDPAKLANVRLELDLLEKTWRDAGCAEFDVARDERALQDVNERSPRHARFSPAGRARGARWPASPDP